MDNVSDELNAISLALRHTEALRKQLQALYDQKKRQKNEAEKAKEVKKPEEEMGEFVESELSEDEYSPEKNDFEELDTFEVKNGKVDKSENSDNATSHNLDVPPEFTFNSNSQSMIRSQKMDQEVSYGRSYVPPQKQGQYDFSDFDCQKVLELINSRCSTMAQKSGHGQNKAKEPEEEPIITKYDEASDSDDEFAQELNARRLKAYHEALYGDPSKKTSYRTVKIDELPKEPEEKEESAEEEIYDTQEYPRGKRVQVGWIDDGYEDTYVDDFDFTADIDEANRYFGIPKNGKWSPEKKKDANPTETDAEEVKAPEEPKVDDTLKELPKSGTQAVQNQSHVPSFTQGPSAVATPCSPAESTADNIVFEGPFRRFTVITRDGDRDILKREMDEGKIRLRLAISGTYIEVFQDNRRISRNIIDKHFSWELKNNPGEISWSFYNHLKEQTVFFSVKFSLADDIKAFFNGVQQALRTLVPSEIPICKFVENCVLHVLIADANEMSYNNTKVEVFADEMGRNAYINFTVSPETSLKFLMNQDFAPYKNENSVLFRAQEESLKKEILYCCKFEQEASAKTFHDFILTYHAGPASDEQSE
ncbi:unnamed protein product [Bursaphelenchus xylophilus]|uniref:(pine wood nematode) hypothetical protein n=1 Tax=Bursaphelenchus xylophilus TaxID=6326 RepID=A0A1I7SSB3_BURXY|nr:unnamed protein product [Bursaphelenchus xylophilus]CAG9097778.1 unnamed protein product [Bursaphelenchus xylophilus]